MEDDRTQHPLIRVPPVDLIPLAECVKAEPTLRLVILDCYPQLNLNDLARVAPAGQVCFDVAMVEGVGDAARLMQSVSLERVLFGSHFPLFYMESARLKMGRSGLSDAQQKALCSGNALRLLNR